MQLVRSGNTCQMHARSKILMGMHYNSCLSLYHVSMLPLISILLLLSLLLLGSRQRYRKQDLDNGLIPIVFPVLSRQGTSILTSLSKVLAFKALPCTVQYIIPDILSKLINQPQRSVKKLGPSSRRYYPSLPAQPISLQPSRAEGLPLTASVHPKLGASQLLPSSSPHHHLRRTATLKTRGLRGQTFPSERFTNLSSSTANQSIVLVTQLWQRRSNQRPAWLRAMWPPSNHCAAPCDCKPPFRRRNDERILVSQSHLCVP